MKSFLSALLLMGVGSLVAQNSPVVSELQMKYKDSPVAIQTSDITYEFSRDVSQKLVKIAEKKEQRYLSLRYNQTITEFISYDNNSVVEKFWCSSSMKQAAPDAMKYCGTYTSDGFFYDDSKFCSHNLKLKELGEVWTINSVKKIKDAKYQPSVYFQSEYPVLSKTVKFIIPSDIDVELREFNFEGFTISREETTNGENRVVTYTMSGLDPFQNVNFKPGLQFYSPHLLILVKSMKNGNQVINQLSSTNDLYSWYHSLTAQLKPTPEVFRPVVESLIKDKKTDEEKMSSIFYWVQDNIRYIAYEDGIAGFKPDEAQNVYEKKYGDCKGMANLTKEMLKLAGYDARLTWIGTKSIRYDYSIPSLAVDNHMICTVILNGKKYYLDATEDYNPLGEYAERIQNRPVMIEDGDRYILDKVPGADKTKDLQKHLYTAKINGERLEGAAKVTLHGETKKDFLYRYNHTQNDKKTDYLNHFINDGKNDFKVTEVKFGDISQRSGPFDIDFNFSISNSVSLFNNEMYIDIDPSKDFKNGSVKNDRQCDLDFGEKIYRKISIELQIPSDYTVANLPENVTIAEKDFSFNISYKQEGDKIIYNKEINVEKGVVCRADFEKWNAGIKKLSKAYESQITLKKQ
jgi:hypothetical protein